jgi:hypothetical protein
LSEILHEESSPFGVDIEAESSLYGMVNQEEPFLLDGGDDRDVQEEPNDRDTPDQIEGGDLPDDGLDGGDDRDVQQELNDRDT